MIELDVAERALHLRRQRRRARAAPRRRGRRRSRALRARLLEALRRPRAAGRPGRRPRLPGRQQRRLRAAGQPLMLQAADLTIRLHPDDDVVIARVELPAGTSCRRRTSRVAVRVPPGHKVAMRAVAQGAAGAPLQPDHRLRHAAASRRASTCTCTTSRWATSSATTRSAPTPSRPQYVEPPATFMGIVRADGRVATRNYIGILSTVNCSATVARDDRRPLQGRRAGRRIPNVDGVVALTHKTGCGMDTQGEAMRRPAPHARRLRAPSRTSPASLIVGLGCEANQINALLGAQELKRATRCCARSPSRRRAARARRSRTASRAIEGDAAGREQGEARAGARVAHHARPAVRRLGRLLGHHAPIRRSAPRSTCWCATAARRSCPRRPRSTAPSTCSRAARCRARSARS